LTKFRGNIFSLKNIAKSFRGYFFDSHCRQQNSRSSHETEPFGTQRAKMPSNIRGQSRVCYSTETYLTQGEPAPGVCGFQYMCTSLIDLFTHWRTHLWRTGTEMWMALVECLVRLSIEHLACLFSLRWHCLASLDIPARTSGKWKRGMESTATSSIRLWPLLADYVF